MTSPRESEAESLDFWRDRLSGPLPQYDFLLDHPRPPVQSYLRESKTLSLGPQLYRRFAEFCRRNEVPLLVVLLSAFKALFHRYSGESDTLVGTLLPAAGKCNPVALRTDLSGNPTVQELIRRVSTTVQAAAEFSNVPFDILVEKFEVDFALDRGPIFQVMLVLLDDLLNADDAAYAQSHSARCDLVLVAAEADGDLQLTAEHDPQLFDPSTVRRLLGHFQTLLTGLVASPEIRLAALPLLTPAERQQLSEWVNTTVSYPRDRTVPQLFESQAAQTPESTAVVFGDQRLTYAQLNRCTNKLARYLRDLGVGPESLVGLYIDRSLEMVIGLLAILKAGGAYVPLDTGYPRERLRAMLAETRSPIILTLARLTGGLPEFEARVICLNSAWPDIERESPENLDPVAAAENLAYVMFTSGSTGRPKGIAVIHRGIVRLVKGANYASLTPAETFLQLAPISFDASTLEIWGALLNGAKLVVAPAHALSLADLAWAIEEHGVTTLWLTAGLFHQMAEAYPESLLRVRQLLAGGDVLQVPQVKKILRDLKGGTLVNCYGPTENTTFTCCYPMNDPAQVGETVPIGRPISNTQVYILNEALQPVPVGLPGELYVGGDGLARGYLNQSRLTAERFISSPFGRGPGERLYKTGDLARWLPDGTIEFLGRIDDQVKIRGFRIEPREIETVLGGHPAVTDIVVKALTKESGEKYIVAYVVPSNAARSSAPLSRDLRQYLQERLPHYMLPAAFVFLDEMPLNSNGKVDRTALLVPDDPRPDLKEQYAPPSDPVEEVLVKVWGEILGYERIG
ncbi:MAG: amino acid adenylation domain-containing protein, partial [Candidatus Zixiibacteriota bacterium]